MRVVPEPSLALLLLGIDLAVGLAVGLLLYGISLAVEHGGWRRAGEGFASYALLPGFLLLAHALVTLTGGYGWRGLLSLGCTAALAGTLLYRRALLSPSLLPTAALTAAYISLSAASLLHFGDRHLALYAITQCLLLGMSGLALRWIPYLGVDSVRRRAVAATLVALTLAGTFVARDLAYATPPGGTLREARPNVLLVVMDTVRADHLSLYGYDRPTTPNLEAFAKDATRYDSAFATAAFTLPTHASMWTGTYPSDHHVTDARRLAADTTSIAELLSAAGYATMGVIANVGFLARHFGLNQGFAHYDVRYRGRLEGGLPPKESIGGWLARRILPALRAREVQTTRSAGQITREALRLLRARGKGAPPFFLYLNYMDAHTPYLPPSPYSSRFAEDPDFRYDWRAFHQYRKAYNRGEAALDPALQRYFSDHYDGGIAYIDFEIGKLLESLRGLGLYDKTLIILTSDHGEALGEHDFLGHGGFVYQQLIELPLVIRFPGTGSKPSYRGQRVQEAVSQVDFLPTIMNVVGLSSPPVRGRVLRPAPIGPHRFVFAESHPSPRMVDDNPRYKGWRAASMRDGLKYVAFQDGRSALYDLDRDPLEQIDLKSELDASRYAAALQKLIGSGLREPAPRHEEQLDPETRSRLRALGYAE